MPRPRLCAHTRARQRLAASVLALLATVTVLALAPDAGASPRQIHIIQADPPMLADPAGTLAAFRALGASTVRVIVHWDFIAPDPKARAVPAGFRGADPNSYPAARWAPYDAIVTDARAAGITVDFTVAGGAPIWAQGAHIPASGLANQSFAWKPSTRLYGDFVHAVGERYDGSFHPAGAVTTLPAVRFWALWNEPNFGQDLGPQAIDGSTLSVGPMMYRRLVDRGWRALAQTGHGADTILIGGLAAEGRSGPVNRSHPEGLPGDYAQTKPLQFIRTLYCLDARDRPLRGGYARARGCPRTVVATRAFRARHPGLFGAGGFADHPYSGGRSPVDAGGLDHDFATFPQLGGLQRTLDRALRAYGSDRRLPIYCDEYGYITRPPSSAPYVSPAIAAEYLNWSEYLSWRSPRVASYAQYLLADPVPGTHVGFASGLETPNGAHKATYDAYRLPLYLPSNAPPARRGTEVWGAARPASFMALDGHGPQTVAIQLQAGARGPWSTVRTVGATGYFDVRVRFPHAGNVRLAYRYPAPDPFLPAGMAGSTAYSRVVRVSRSR